MNQHKLYLKIGCRPFFRFLWIVRPLYDVVASFNERLPKSQEVRTASADLETFDKWLVMVRSYLDEFGQYFIDQISQRMDRNPLLDFVDYDIKVEMEKLILSQRVLSVNLYLQLRSGGGIVVSCHCLRCRDALLHWIGTMEKEEFVEWYVAEFARKQGDD